MSILHRTLLAFGLVVAVFIAQGLFVAVKLSALVDMVSISTRNPITEVDAARAAWDYFGQAHEHLETVTAGIRYQDSKAALAEFKSRADRVEEQLRRVESVAASAQATDLIRHAAGLFATWRADGQILLGERPATAIPAPHVMTQLAERIGARLNQIVAAAVAAAESSRLSVQAEAEGMRWWATALLGTGALLGIVLAIGSALSITRPMARIEAAMRAVSEGQLDTEVTDHARRDEIGSMARTLAIFRANAEEMQRMEVEKRAAEDANTAGRKAELNKLADRFQATAGHIVDTVSSAAVDLESAARGLASTAATTRDLSTTVASSAGEASTNVRSVATVSEQLGQSVNEIASRVQEASRIAGEAVKQADKTDSRISQLSQSAARIGDVIKLITAIAEQTNLLALNATIEAARAGEAGRGFAVVAQEVKALAAQTAKATDEISAQIAGMQRATGESVGDIKEIGGTIARMSEIAAAIASAVEEQSAATQEIARNVQQAAQGTVQVADSIGEVNRGAAETGSASGRVLSAAQSLSTDSTRLKRELDEFLTTIRAA
jgi:methyl-accepting chemotaxis protein